MPSSCSSTPGSNGAVPLIRPYNIFLWLSNLQRDINQQLASINDSLRQVHSSVFAISERQGVNNTVSNAVVASPSLPLLIQPSPYPRQSAMMQHLQGPQSGATPSVDGIRTPTRHIISDNYDQDYADHALPVIHRLQRRPGNAGRRRFGAARPHADATVRRRFPGRRTPGRSSPLPSSSEHDSPITSVVHSSKQLRRNPAYLDVLDQRETHNPHSWQDPFRDDFHLSNLLQDPHELRSFSRSPLLREGAKLNVLEPVETPNLHGAPYLGQQTSSVHAMSSSPRQANSYGQAGPGPSSVRYGHDEDATAAQGRCSIVQRSFQESHKRSREAHDGSFDDIRAVRRPKSPQFLYERPTASSNASANSRSLSLLHHVESGSAHGSVASTPSDNSRKRGREDDDHEAGANRPRRRTREGMSYFEVILSYEDDGYLKTEDASSCVPSSTAVASALSSANPQLPIIHLPNSETSSVSADSSPVGNAPRVTFRQYDAQGPVQPVSSSQHRLRRSQRRRNKKGSD